MDQYNISAIVVALITGVFSIIAIVIQRRQDKVIKGIDEKSHAREKEKILQDQLQHKEKRAQGIVHEAILLLLDATSALTAAAISDKTVIDELDLKNKVDALKDEYNATKEDINDIKVKTSVLHDIADASAGMQSTK